MHCEGHQGQQATLSHIYMPTSNWALKCSLTGHPKFVFSLKFGHTLQFCNNIQRQNTWELSARFSIQLWVLPQPLIAIRSLTSLAPVSISQLRGHDRICGRLYICLSWARDTWSPKRTHGAVLKVDFSFGQQHVSRSTLAASRWLHEPKNSPHTSPKKITPCPVHGQD